MAVFLKIIGTIFIGSFIVMCLLMSDNTSQPSDAAVNNQSAKINTSDILQNQLNNLQRRLELVEQHNALLVSKVEILEKRNIFLIFSYNYFLKYLGELKKRVACLERGIGI